MKHLKTEDLIKLCLEIHQDFWNHPIFLECVQIADELDLAVSELEKLDTAKKLKFKSRYNSLKKENPTYNSMLRMSQEDFELLLITFDSKKIQKVIIELSYEKTLLNSMPFVRNLKSFLAEINYKKSNYGKNKFKFGIDPNYTCQAPKHYHSTRNSGYDDD